MKLEILSTLFFCFEIHLIKTPGNELSLKYVVAKRAHGGNYPGTLDFTSFVK